MNFHLAIPSLKHCVSVKIATVLWAKDDLIHSVSEFDLILPLRERVESWKIIEDRVAKKVKNLFLPLTLIEEASNFIKPIGLRLLAFNDFIYWKCPTVIRLQKEYTWTVWGTINQKSTAEALILNETLDVFERYKLACIFSMEKYIPILWAALDLKQQDLACTDVDDTLEGRSLVTFWSLCMREDDGELEKIIQLFYFRDGVSPYQYAFECSICSINETSAMFFFKKLSPDERMRSLENSLRAIVQKFASSDPSGMHYPSGHYNDVLCFALSCMNQQQQLQFFERYPLQVLCCLLEWPWQDLFISTAQHMWAFLRDSQFDMTLWIILHRKVTYGYKDYDYCNLFGMFWQSSPNAMKKYSRSHCFNASVLWKLFQVEDKENIRLFLKDMTNAERANIFFEEYTDRIWPILICNNKRNFLRFFIEECLLSKGNMIRLKKEFETHIENLKSGKKFDYVQEECDDFSQFLDEFIQGHDKAEE